MIKINLTCLFVVKRQCNLTQQVKLLLKQQVVETYSKTEEIPTGTYLDQDTNR